MVDLLDWLCLVHGTPEHLRRDNGPEFVARQVRRWLAERHCQTIFITPSSPWENPFIASFIATLRRECLQQYHFVNVREAQQIVESWRQDYKERRPQFTGTISLGYLTPAEFAT